MFEPNKLMKYNDGDIQIYNGDCVDLLGELEPEVVSLVITSPPYCIGKEYENISDDIHSFCENHREVLPMVIRALRPGGSLCWQVGYHVKSAEIVPLDYIVFNLVNEINEKLEANERMILRNRIIWTFGHGLNSERRLSGRHEVILWYTKGNNYFFNLDSIRVPQKYPGKTYHHGDKKGQISGNPKGKNPSDVWDIPNVKANHVEKTDHPCQFPIAIPQRLIKALTKEGDLILDPYMGSGTAAAAAILEKRRFVGAEIMEDYTKIAEQRIEAAIEGTLRYREDKPVVEPNPNSKVAKKPENFTW